MEYKFKLTKHHYFKMLARFVSNTSTCEKYDSTLRLEIFTKFIRISLEDRNGRVIARGKRIPLKDVENIRLPNVSYQHEVKLEMEE